MFAGYTFVRGRRRTKHIFLANIKARGALLEEVKTYIRKRCKDRDVNVTGIFPLAHHSAREVKIVNKRFKGIEKVFNTNKLFNIYDISSIPLIFIMNNTNR